MPSTRHFLDWDRSAVERAVEWLTQGWASGPLDLRNRLLLVPTRHAGRRLREALAQAAAARGTGVLIGRVEIAPFVFQPPASQRYRVAGKAAELLWRRVIAMAEPALLSRLGRTRTAEEPRLLALRLAAHLQPLRDRLCEEGFDFTGFASHYARTSAEADDELPEVDRWHALAELEHLYRQEIQRLELADDVDDKLAQSAAPVLPSGIQHVVLLFTPDPPPLVLKAIANLAPSVPVEVVVHAPAAHEDQFDVWGRPLPTAWSAQPLSVDIARVEVRHDAIDVASRIADILGDVKPALRSEYAVGTSDPQTAERVIQALSDKGVEAFSPAGRTLARLPVIQVARRLIELMRDPEIRPVSEFIRHPAVQDAFASSRDALLPVWDAFLNHHLPVTLEDAVDRALCEDGGYRSSDDIKHVRTILLPVVQTIKRWKDDLVHQPLTESLPRVLSAIFPRIEAGSIESEQAGLIQRVLSDIESLSPISPTREELIECAAEALAAAELPAARGSAGVEVLGWLELPWENAPALLLADLCDGLIPSATTVDAFLPDQACRLLGLRDQDQRYARDAYLLETLVRSRPPDGFRGFMPRHAEGGEPLKPSRLLLQAEPARIPARALYLFSDAPVQSRAPDTAPQWTLNGPDPLDAGRRITCFSPSSLRQYLRCPFGLYLQKALEIGDPVINAQELEPRDFGTLVHAVMEVFGRSDLVNTQDENELNSYFQRTLDQILQNRFGPSMILPVQLQVDALRIRLQYAARTQAHRRAEGWRIVSGWVEFPFQIEVDGVPVRGRIDRIDRHEKTGALCVMDYKTSAAGEHPDKTHLASLGTIPELMRTCAQSHLPGKRWKDLQLPIYLMAARQLDPDLAHPLEAAYFLLPKAATGTKIEALKAADPDALFSARDCASRIIRRVHAGVFWPPIERYGVDDARESVFRGDVAAHLSPSLLKSLQERADWFYEQEETTR